jgi:hypothetical protein
MIGQLVYLKTKYVQAASSASFSQSSGVKINKKKGGKKRKL